MEYVLSEKGKPKLCYNNFLFIEDRSVDTKVYWKCDLSRKYKCRARVTTVDGQVSSSNNDHNHNADAAKLEATKVMQRIREDAENTRDSPQYILSQASTHIREAVAAKLPSVGNMKRTIRKVRERKQVAPANPSSREDLVLPNEFTKSEAGETFLLFDSGVIPNRILIFSTRSNITLLAQSQNWYADGTFKVVPTLFEQLYTIHGLKDNVAIPLVFALLPNKTEQTYIKLLQEIKNVLPAGAGPRTIMTDFELAMINAVQQELPDTVHRGCFFHFSQCIFRHIQSNGLQREYEQNPQTALTLKMLPALAFVPTNDVVNAFDHLCDQNMFPPELRAVVDYFEDTWIGRPQRRGRQRRQPLFAHTMWNCYDGVRDGLPKTNNFIEGWHRGFQMQISADHPSIWKFISALKREQSLNELKIEQYISGEQPQVGHKRYRDSADRLLRLVNNYEPQINICDYIRGISHNLSY